MTEEKNEVIFDDDKISKSEEFVNPDELYQELIQCVQKYHPSDDISMIEKAYKVASEAHKNQFRKSGEPYIIHPLNHRGRYPARCGGRYRDDGRGS